MAVRDTGRPFAVLLAGLAMLALTPRPALAADDDQTLLLAMTPKAAQAAQDANDTLLLELTVNGHATDKVGRFVLRDGALFAAPDELHDLGIKVPQSVANETLIALSALPDFTYRIDQPTQTLYVTAATSALSPEVLGSWAQTPGKVTVQSGTGATFNYDVVGASLNDRPYASGLFDIRAFSPWGVLSSGLLAYAGQNPEQGGQSAIRLDTTYTYSDPNSLRRYRVGDFINGFLSWTRPVRLGGAQIISDFSMRPDLITFPVPSVAGSVAVPSTVDVLVNGNRVLSTEVQPGPFQIPHLPVITGAGTVSMTVTNALGQQVTTEMPFYAAPTLLKPGLESYSIDVGATRRDWGILSNDYGYPAASATYRRGLTDSLTVEGHVEGSRGLFMGGAGIVMEVANFAVVNLALAASGGDDHLGAQLAIGIQRVSPRFSFGVSAILATPNYGDIAAANGEPAPQVQLNANVGLSLGRFGAIGAAYVDLEQRQPTLAGVVTPTPPVLTPGAFFAQPATASRIVSISYSNQIHNVAIYATAFSDVAPHGGEGVSVGLTIPLGHRSSLNLSVQAQPGTESVQAEATRTTQTIGDWGYRLFVGQGQPDHEFAEVSYESRWGLFTAGVDQLGDRTSLQGEARGALSIADHGIYPSDWIDDSFAVVDTGIAGIRVDDENREVGRTGSNGTLLLPDLRSYQLNHLSIDPLDAPADATVPFTTRDVRPADRSGVIVKFPIKRSHGALLLLTDVAGNAMPVGSHRDARFDGRDSSGRL